MTEDQYRPEECSFCWHETDQLNRLEALNGSVGWLCDVCYTTIAGNAYSFPRQHERQESTLRMIAACTNKILDAINDTKKER